jgi:hypothetical protein
LLGQELSGFALIHNHLTADFVVRWPRSTDHENSANGGPKEVLSAIGFQCLSLDLLNKVAT